MKAAARASSKHHGDSIPSRSAIPWRPRCPRSWRRGLEIGRANPYSSALAMRPAASATMRDPPPISPIKSQRILALVFT